MNNYCIAVKEKGDDIVFLRKIVKGGADKSYGIQVAKLAGVPDSVIERAKELVEELSDADITERAKEIEAAGSAPQAKTATKEDIRDNLFFEFAEEKLPIIKMERESLSLEDVFLKLTGQDVEEVESEAKKASEQIEKQGHHGFSFKRKKKADSKGTEQAETAEEDK